MSTPIITVEHLSKRYIIGHQRSKDDGLRHLIEDAVRAPLRWLRSRREQKKQQREVFWALKDVSFEVKQGEVLGIIGRNGAGKSTLLKILSRITEPTSGRIEIDGRVASLLEVGTGFHQELTGRENIFLNGAILGMTRLEIKRKFDEIVAFSEVEKFLDTPVKRYSSGMYVRLAFAVAAHLEPEILIVDEVLAVGDASFQKKCLGKMQDVSEREGRTVLFVSHNMAAVTTLTNKALFLAAGQTQFIGDTSEAIGRYMAAGQNDSFVFSDEQLGSTPKIISVKMKTSHQGNVHIHHDPLEIEVRVHTPIAIAGACVSIQVFDSNQTNYLHVWTHDVNLPMCRQPGIYVLKCLIPKLRLYMGRYRLRVFFSEPPGGQSFQTLDGICPFEVVMQNTHRLFPWWPNECAYLEDCSWEVSRINT